MLVCVAFEYVAGCVCVSVDVALETLTCAALTSSAGGEISKEEGSCSLMSSSTIVVGTFWLRLSFLGFLECILRFVGGFKLLRQCQIIFLGLGFFGLEA